MDTGLKNGEFFKAMSPVQDAAQKYAELFDFSPTGYFSLSREGVIVEINQSGSRMFGKAIPDLLNKNVDLFISEDTKTIFNIFLKKILSSNNRETCHVTLSANDRVPMDVRLTGIYVGSRDSCLIAAIDITEQVNIERTLRESENHYHTLTEISPVGIFRTDAEGSTTYVNPCWCRISGLSASEALGDGWLKAVLPEDREIINIGWKQATSAHTVSSTEYRFIHADGSVSWVIGHAVPEVNSDNKVIGYVGTITDITSRKHAEDTIRISEEKYRLITEKTTDVIWLMDLKGESIYVSPSIERFTGFTVEEFLKQSMDERYTPESVIIAKNLLARELTHSGEDYLQLKDYIFIVELEYRCKNGMTKWGDILITPYFGNGNKLMGIHCVTRDITDRKDAEEKLRLNDEKFRRVVENIHDALIMDDVDGKVIFANERYMTLFGFQPEDLEHLSIVDYVAPEWKEKIWDRHNSRVRGEDVATNFECEAIRKDGQRIWIEVNVLAIKDNSGKIIGTQSSLRDITDRKHAEEERREADNTFAQMFYKSPVAILLIDSDNGFIIDVNKTFLRDMEYTQEEVIGHNSAELGLFDDINDRQHLLNNLKENGFVLGHEYCFRSKSRKVFYGLLSVVFITVKGKKCQLNTIIDITESKLAEKALRESEGRFRRISEQLSELVAIADANGIITYASPASCSILQYTPAELYGRRITDFIADQDIPNTLSRFRAAVERGEIIKDLELRMKRKDGSVFIGELTGSRLHFGQQTDMLAIIRDITGRKLIEDRIKASEEKYRSIFEWAPVGIYQTAINGQFLSVNQRMAVILGYDSIPDLQKRNIETDIYISATDRQMAIERNEISGFILNHELRWKKKDGTPIWISMSAHAVKDQDGTTQYFEGFVSDITQQKLADEKSTMLSHAIKSISEGVSITDKEDHLLFVNNMFLRMYQYEEHELLGKHISMVVSENNVPGLVRQVLPTTIGGGWQGELLNRKKDGTEFPIFLSTSAIRDETGTPVAFIGVATDITERRKIQEEISSLNAELEQRVADRTAEIEATIKELEAFTYTVSHDLRAPLRAIDGFTSILLEDYQPLFDDGGKRLCSRIKENALQMGQLIDDLLAFSRLGRSGLNSSRINMNELAGFVYNEITSPEMRLQINFQQGDLVAVSGDQALLHQVWTNLISNAIKFSFHREHPVIKISGTRNQNVAVFTIADNGTGFDMKYSNKLFGVFQRLHSVKEFDGTGVGLAIVKRIVKKHGGEVWAEGEIDKGASFSFSLPIDSCQPIHE